MRVDENQLDHFLTFITSPHVVQDLPFGLRKLQLSNGQVIETPNVIRTMIKEQTIKQYTQFCEQTNFKPFSYSTMHRILTSCTASVRKSLQGLDYISAEGGTAFDELSAVVDKLIDHGLDKHKGTTYQEYLKEGKQPTIVFNLLLVTQKNQPCNKSATTPTTNSVNPVKHKKRHS